ncbi:MAG TPA: glycosyltransferase 87 family protein, partial [Flavitalea sp.]|nr:glycosyltransferase 87 family protein [Flavitalea sp.]
VLLIFLSLILEVIGVGKKGIHAAQIGGILVGVFLGLIGWGLRSLPENKKPWREILVEKVDAFLNVPVIVWVLTGFLIIFLVYFVRPMFFDSSQKFSYFVDYLPALNPIGNDLNYNTQAITLWLQGKSPYELGYHFYPPLYHVVFAPILLFGAREKYVLMTGLTLLSFGLLFFLLWRKNASSHGVFVFFFLTGLLSYGMQFELERGQFNVLTLLLVITGIWIYHNFPSFRLLAYTLWIIAAHIKLYPGVFLLMFFSHWNNRKENFITLLQLGILNAAAFLILGYKAFQQFVTAVIAESRNPLWVLPAKQPVNHSIDAFIDKLAKNNDSELPAKLADWVSSSGSWLGIILLAVIVLCSVTIIWRTLQNRPNLLHADALMLFILLGFLLPNVSMDYKLVLLAPGLAVVLANRTLPELRWQKVLFIGFTVLMSAAYSLTLVPYQYRSGLLLTAFPMLFTLLLCLTGLNLLNKTWQEVL